MDPRVAVVGCGRWGRNLARVFHELGALGAIVDADPRATEEIRATCPGALVRKDLRDVLADPSLQAVVVATPAATHFALARQALEAGRDVFVEKPLALRVDEGESLVRVAESTGRILMVGHLLVYHPAVAALKSILDRGDLGRIQYVYSRRLNLGQIRTEENILWSFAPHDISMMIHLLGEMPSEVSAHGWSFLRREIADVTLTTLWFPSGVGGHITVSWLNPFKEQRLVVVGDRQMAVFDDTAPKDKLVLYPHHIEWVSRQPIPHRENGKVVDIDASEPLRQECAHFLECIQTRRAPRTDGRSALDVLRILDAAQRSLQQDGKRIPLVDGGDRAHWAHETAIVDDGATVGPGTRIWHFTHVMPGARIGRDCVLGQNCFVARNVTIGDGVKIQNNVSIYEGVTLEDGVFCGPSVVFTNVVNPRSHVSRKDEYRATLVRRGATIGANATVVCGHTIGEFAFVGAGAVVTRDVPDHALMLGVPARSSGWVCRCGVRLPSQGIRLACEACGDRYEVKDERIARVT